MNEKKSYKVQIFEEQYVLLSDETEASVIKAAKMVDENMKNISLQSTITDPKKIAVLTALRIASKLLSLEDKHNKEQGEKRALIDYIDKELFL